MIVGSRSAVPDDIKAASPGVRSIKFSDVDRLRLPCGRGRPPRVATFGGKPKFCVGGMLYCAGPSALCRTVRDPRHNDVLRTGQCGTNGRRSEMDGELIDFTCGDWPHLEPTR